MNDVCVHHVVMKRQDLTATTCRELADVAEVTPKSDTNIVITCVLLTTDRIIS